MRQVGYASEKLPNPAPYGRGLLFWQTQCRSRKNRPLSDFLSKLEASGSDSFFVLDVIFRLIQTLRRQRMARLIDLSLSILVALLWSLGVFFVLNWM